jgi:hypothetical protein
MLASTARGDVELGSLAVLKTYTRDRNIIVALFIVAASAVLEAVNKSLLQDATGNK